MRRESTRNKPKKDDPPSLIFMIGGRGAEGEPLSTAEIIDTKSMQQEWEELEPMPEPRWGAAAASWGSKIWVFGGYNGGPILKTGAVFDPDEGEWAPLPLMSTRRAQPCVTAVGRRIYVCGGYGGTHGKDGPLDSCERFDPEEQVWEAMPKMSAKRFNAASTVIGPTLYMLGGATDKPEPLKSVERFDAKEVMKWEKLPDMSERRQGHGAAVLKGFVYVCGGHDGSECLDSVERFFPDEKGRPTGEWKAAASMSMPRYMAACCTVLHSDQRPKVVVFGGHNGTERVRTLECCQFDAKEWQPIPKDERVAGRRMEVRAGAALGAMMPAVPEDPPPLAF